MFDLVGEWLCIVCVFIGDCVLVLVFRLLCVCGLFGWWFFCVVVW